MSSNAIAGLPPGSRDKPEQLLLGPGSELEISHRSTFETDQVMVMTAEPLGQFVTGDLALAVMDRQQAGVL